MKKIFYLSLAILSLGLFSCEKMLNYPPDGAILAEDALKTPDDAQRLLNSCYDVMANVFDGSYQNLAELLSNNLADPNGLDFQSVYNKKPTSLRLLPMACTVIFITPSIVATPCWRTLT